MKVFNLVIMHNNLIFDVFSFKTMQDAIKGFERETGFDYIEKDTNFHNSKYAESGIYESVIE